MKFSSSLALAAALVLYIGCLGCADLLRSTKGGSQAAPIGIRTETRAVCPKCGSQNTWAHYEHIGCPKPTGANASSWEKEAMLTKDGVPQPMPCPGCNALIAPSYLYCKDCGHRW